MILIRLLVEQWASAHLNVEKEGARSRVAISKTVQRHIITFYDGPLGHNLEPNILSRIWKYEYVIHRYLQLINR